MQMHIRHETIYSYDRPVKYSVQTLHLTPRRDACQRAITWNIAAPGRPLEQIDAHGNISHLLTIEQPHREIRIVVRGIVETADTESRQDDGPLSPLAYLAPTLLTTADDALPRSHTRQWNAPKIRGHESRRSPMRCSERCAISPARATCKTPPPRPSKAAKAYARIMPTCTSPPRARREYRRAM